MAPSYEISFIVRALEKVQQTLTTAVCMLSFFQSHVPIISGVSRCTIWECRNGSGTVSANILFYSEFLLQEALHGLLRKSAAFVTGQGGVVRDV